MTQIIEFIIALAVIFFFAGIAVKVYKRAYLIRVMNRIAKIKGVTVKRRANPFLSLFRLSREAEYTVEVYGRRYAVRIYNGEGGGNAVHFANEKFTVVYSRLKTGIAPRGRFFTLRGFSVGAKVKVLPKLTVPEEFRGRDFCEVILFNPAPAEVSYVVKEKTSIRVAFTGDEIFERRIFTASTFEIFIDREARRIKDERAGEYYDPWSAVYN